MQTYIFIVGTLTDVWRQVNEQAEQGYRAVAMSVVADKYAGYCYHVLMELHQVAHVAPTIHIQEDAMPAMGRI
jgi:hypothetical protein